MTELSPTAQAVLNATGRKTWYRNNDIAAALKTAADQVVPPNPCGDDCCITQCEEIRAQLLAIAAELEDNAND